MLRHMGSSPSKRSALFYHANESSSPHRLTFAERPFLVVSDCSGIVVRIAKRSCSHLEGHAWRHYMKRIVAAVAFGVLLCASGARAERYSQGSRPHAKHILVGVDTEFGIPLGDYSDVNSVGAGALVVGEFP